MFVVRRAMIGCGLRQNTTAHEIQEIQDLDISLSRFRQLLSPDPHLGYVKVKRKPDILPYRKPARVAWANEHTTRTLPQWFEVIWTGRKRFSIRNRTHRPTTGIIKSSRRESLSWGTRVVALGWRHFRKLGVILQLRSNIDFICE